MKRYVRPFYGGENKSWESPEPLCQFHANLARKNNPWVLETKFGHMKYYSLSEGEKMAKQTQNLGYYWYTTSPELLGQFQ